MMGLPAAILGPLGAVGSALGAVQTGVNAAKKVGSIISGGGQTPAPQQTNQTPSLIPDNGLLQTLGTPEANPAPSPQLMQPTSLPTTIAKNDEFASLLDLFKRR